METTLAILIKYKYFALFPLAAIEGPVISIVAGFLIHMGYLDVTLSFIILILGDIIPDGIYYYIGRIGNKAKLTEKYASKFKMIEGGAKVMDHLWENHPRKTMFLSKLAYGFSIPFLISAGLAKISYKNFFFYTIPATIFQYGVLMLVGYLLGQSYMAAIKYLKYGGVLFGVILVSFVAAYIWVILFARKEINKMGHD